MEKISMRLCLQSFLPFLFPSEERGWSIPRTGWGEGGFNCHLILWISWMGQQKVMAIFTEILCSTTGFMVPVSPLSESVTAPRPPILWLGKAMTKWKICYLVISFRLSAPPASLGCMGRPLLFALSQHCSVAPMLGYIALGTLPEKLFQSCVETLKQ